MKLLYNKENSVDEHDYNYNVMIYPAHYNDVYAELLFDYIEVSDEEPSKETMEYIRQCIKAGKVLDNGSGYLVGEEFTVDNFHEIVIKDQAILNKLIRL